MKFVLINLRKYHPESYNWIIKCYISGFDSLEVAFWPLVPKFAGSNPVEAVGFFRAKIPQHVFLRK